MTNFYFKLKKRNKMWYMGFLLTIRKKKMVENGECYKGQYVRPKYSWACDLPLERC